MCMGNTAAAPLNGDILRYVMYSVSKNVNLETQSIWSCFGPTHSTVFLFQFGKFRLTESQGQDYYETYIADCPVICRPVVILYTVHKAAECPSVCLSVSGCLCMSVQEAICILMGVWPGSEQWVNRWITVWWSRIDCLSNWCGLTDNRKERKDATNQRHLCRLDKTLTSSTPPPPPDLSTWRPEVTWRWFVIRINPLLMQITTSLADNVPLINGPGRGGASSCQSLSVNQSYRHNEFKYLLIVYDKRIHRYTKNKTRKKWAIQLQSYKIIQSNNVGLFEEVPIYKWIFIQLEITCG